MFPNFLGVGAPKSGTTWLYVQFKNHPEIWVPPIKELHYFNEKEINPNFGFRKRLFGTHPTFRRWRRKVKNQIFFSLLKFRLKDLRWKVRCLFLTNNDSRYSSLFNSNYKVYGEITPDYVVLEKQTIREIKRMNPDCKIIFLLRNPIERVWSQAMNNLTKMGKIPFSRLNKEDILYELNKSVNKERSNYPKILHNWKSVFDKDQIFIRFYEEIQFEPEKLLLDLFDFLGVKKLGKSAFPQIDRKIHSGAGLKIPYSYRKYLVEQYYDQLVELSNEIGSYSKDWLNSAEEIFNS